MRTLFEAGADVRAESKNGNTDLAAAAHCHLSTNRLNEALDSGSLKALSAHLRGPDVYRDLPSLAANPFHDEAFLGMFQSTASDKS